MLSGSHETDPEQLKLKNTQSGKGVALPRLTNIVCG